MFLPVLSQVQSNIEAIESGQSLTYYNMIGKKLPPPEMRGNYHLFDGFTTADILITSGEVFKDQKINIDLKNNNIEILHEGEWSILVSTLVREIILKNGQIFYNTMHLGMKGLPQGFVEILADGSIMVLRRPYIEIRRPNYVPGVGVGDKNYKILKKEKFFIGTHTGFKEFKKTRKKNINYFASSDATLQFIKNNKLKLNKIKDFVSAAEFYNELN